MSWMNSFTMCSEYSFWEIRIVENPFSGSAIFSKCIAKWTFKVSGFSLIKISLRIRFKFFKDFLNYQ